MEIAETWFRQGESSFSDFIETQAVWYNFQLAYARARADYGKYLARLEGFVGLNLTRKRALQRTAPERMTNETK
jgi:outer membrane protein TolC